MKLRAGRNLVTSTENPRAQPSRKHSRSPLIDPAVCSLVLIAPSDDFFSKSTRAFDSHRRKNKALVAAARIVSVPTFLCCWQINSVTYSDSQRKFACDAGCVWKNEAFVNALDSEDRSALIISGYWLDSDVTVAALCALADCYDVYVPLDASPAKSKERARLAEVRILQAGATPLLTEHVMKEWAIETLSSTQRNTLTALIKKWG